MAARKVAFALHGGAGARPGVDYGREVVHMRGVVEASRDRLAGGAAALDVVTLAIEAMEEAGLYVAGRGAAANTAGAYELDASLMDGRDRRAGAVAALSGIRSPIQAARAVMENTPHVMLAGIGAAAFARTQGLAEIGEDDAWFVPATGARREEPLTHGTVGCVALDDTGALAAGTSTGGVFGKLPGRVGDTPIVGAGVWADDRVAVSCTGVGEMFIRAAVTAQIAHRMRFAGETLAAAAGAALDDVKRLGGDGGLIAIDAEGRIADPFNSRGMKRAWLTPDGDVGVKVFEPGGMA